eukprot:13498654-Heterocapsa_arctica.AAC.1
MESDVESVNETMDDHMDTQEKAKQARMFLVNRMKNIRVQKDSDKAKNVHLNKKQVPKGNCAGRAHGSHIDRSTGYENAEQGARQATLDRW